MRFTSVQLRGTAGFLFAPCFPPLPSSAPSAPAPSSTTTPSSSAAHTASSCKLAYLARARVAARCVPGFRAAWALRGSRRGVGEAQKCSAHEQVAGGRAPTPPPRRDNAQGDTRGGRVAGRGVTGDRRVRRVPPPLLAHSSDGARTSDSSKTKRFELLRDRFAITSLDCVTDIMWAFAALVIALPLAGAVLASLARGLARSPGGKGRYPV